MAQQQSGIKEREKVRFISPSQYDVIIHNDDFTPMDVVVYILMSVFRKPQAEAVQIMLKVHHSERGVAGTYTLDIAHSKKAKGEKIARELGYPLRFTVEEVCDLPF